MEVPACALNRRRSSTVLVRIMDMCEFCKRPGVRAWMDTDETKTSYCELCSKVTSLGQICAPGTASSKRGSSKWSSASKKVRLCAASCLLLLVGAFPATAGAPHTQDVTLEKIAMVAELAYIAVSSYKDEFKTTYLWNSKQTFSDYLQKNKYNDNPLQHVSWFDKDVLPDCKIFDSAADKACLLSVISNKNQTQLQDLHKIMYRSLNYVTAKFEKMVKQMMKIQIGTKELNNKMLKSVPQLKLAADCLKIYLQGEAPYAEGLRDIAELPEIKKLDEAFKAVTYSSLLNFLQYYQQLYAELSNRRGLGRGEGC